MARLLRNTLLAKSAQYDNSMMCADTHMGTGLQGSKIAWTCKPQHSSCCHCMQLCRVPLDGHQLLHHQYPYLNPLMTAEIIAPIGAKTKTRYSECSLSELDRLAQSCDGESQVQDGVLDAENPYHPHPAHIASHSGARSDLDGKPRKAMRKYMHIVSESFLLLRLAVQLWSFLGLGWRWTLNFVRLVVYAMLLLPGFIQMIVFYFFSPRVVRSLPYGRQPRQRLDLYFPPRMEQSVQYPVVIYITGGAWTIGYKAWGALLARRMSKHGVIVACSDYRNFPQGGAAQMLEDINTSIVWVQDAISKFQGDAENITLVGQSAGGHLACLALFKQAELAANGEAGAFGASPSWSPSSLRAFVGVSGAYDLDTLAEHLHKRGLYRGLFGQIMSIDGKPAYHALSPLHLATGFGQAEAASLPAMYLVHGTIDKSVPYECSVMLQATLQGLGVSSACRIFEGKSHTSFLLEDPMRGGRDLLMDIILEVVTGSEQNHKYAALCPKVLCDWAGWVCPF